MGKLLVCILIIEHLTLEAQTSDKDSCIRWKFFLRDVASFFNTLINVNTISNNSGTTKKWQTWLESENKIRKFSIFLHWKCIISYSVHLSVILKIAEWPRSLNKQIRKTTAVYFLQGNNNVSRHVVTLVPNMSSL